MKKPITKQKFVVVTTVHKGVFGGYLAAKQPADYPTTISLEKAHCCVYWPAEVRGFIGLAVTGPVKGSKVGPPAPCMTLTGVTAVLDATQAAENQWTQMLWN